MHGSTKVLVTGATGMLGRDLVATLADATVTALGHADLDVTNDLAVDDAVADKSVVVNCAAFTKVDNAETEETTAFAVNATGARNLARSAAHHGATLIQISTDYVFDGAATAPYPEDAPLCALSVYGRSKADGERLATAENPGRTVVVRTAWLYGEHGNNFASTMLRLAKVGEPIRVVDDQFGQPTWTMDVAIQISRILSAGVKSGTFHATNSGSTTRYEFARAVLQSAGLDPSMITPISSATLTERAPRPRYSVLGHDAWEAVGIAPLRHWRSALSDAIDKGALKVA